MKRTKTIIIFICKILLSAILVFLALRRVNISEVMFRLRTIDLFLPGAALMCFVVALFLAARRWQVLSGGLLSYAQTLRYTWIGVFYSSILPGAISGDVVKGASLALKSKNVRVGELPLSIAMDRVMGLYSLLGFFVISCAILALGTGSPNPGIQRLGIYGFIGGGTALLLGACAAGLIGKALGRSKKSGLPSSKVSAFLIRAFDTLQLYKRQPGLLVKAAAYSLMIHSMCVMSFYLVIRALGLDCHAMEVVIFYSIVAVLISLPVTISGVGVRDWFSLTFFQSFWGDGQAGVAFAWLVLSFTLITAMAGGMVQIADLFDLRLNKGGQNMRYPEEAN